MNRIRLSILAASLLTAGIAGAQQPKALKSSATAPAPAVVKTATPAAAPVAVDTTKKKMSRKHSAKKASKDTSMMAADTSKKMARKHSAKKPASKIPAAKTPAVK
jgi:hypothetical protein